jgi:hypothetical protein
VDADDTAIDAKQAPVDLTVGLPFRLQAFEDSFPQAFGRPASKPFVDRFPVSETLRQVTPRGAGCVNPKGSVDDRAVTLPWLAASASQWEQIDDLRPLLVGKLMSFHHTLLGWMEPLSTVHNIALQLNLELPDTA